MVEIHLREQAFTLADSLSQKGFNEQSVVYSRRLRRKNEQLFLQIQAFVQKDTTLEYRIIHTLAPSADRGRAERECQNREK